MPAASMALQKSPTAFSVEPDTLPPLATTAERHAAAALAHGVGRTLGSWIVSGGGRDDGTAHPREREFLAQTAVVPARPLT